MKAILLNRILLVLAFVGLFVAGTLSIEAKTGAVVPCGPSGGCALVAQHPSSKLFGIPVAYIGFVGYLLLAGLAIMRASKGVHQSRGLVTAGYIVAAVGTMASLVLQYVSFFVIRAACLWCLSSAAIMVITLILHALLAQELDNDSVQPDAAPGFGKMDLPLIGALPIALLIGLFVMNGRMVPAAPKLDVPPEEVSKVEFVPENANIYGQKDAPVTIVEFADILCPACQTSSPAVKDFVSENPGKVRLVFRHYPLQQIHPQAMAAAAIAEASADQGKFWDFTLAVMGQKMAPESPDELLETAKVAGIDTKKVRERLTNKQDEIYARVARDLQAVKALGITSTPTFFIMANGKVIGTAGPGQILPKMQEPEIQAAMNVNSK
ncbi:MAG: thioredoxin domain-containing protein [Fimbriimonas sp.]